MATGHEGRRPLQELSEADQEFVVRLVLASGSLKDVARAYGVSYPTIRARLDKLVERLDALVKGRHPDPMADLLAELVEGGQLTVPAARRVLELHRSLVKKEPGDGGSVV